MAMLPLRIGQPLRASDLRDSIQRLYQTGEYADIAVDATLAARRSEPRNSSPNPRISSDTST